MRDIKLNNQGDIEINSMNDIRMIDSIEEISQRLRHSLITEMKEWFLDLDFGIPWIDMLQEKTEPEVYRKEVLKVLKSDQAVKKVLYINTEFDRQNRYLEIDFKVQLDEGTIEESVVIE